MPQVIAFGKAKLFDMHQGGRMIAMAPCGSFWGVVS
jgi:hypothetical protein